MRAKSLRTMMFVPGYMTRFLDRAVEFDADALILDLEDSVPDAHKQEARENVRRYLHEERFSQQVFVRVNSIDSGLLTSDLEWGMHPGVDGFMFTKLRDERDVVYYDKLLTQLERDRGFDLGTFSMCPLIETASAVLRAHEIATASPRMIALVFGAEDYLQDLDGLHKEHGTSILVPRTLIVIAARAAHIDPIDTPFLDIRDAEGFQREVALSRELGFSGTLVVHPTQIPVANRAYAPSAEEVEEAKRIIAAIEESSARGLGVALLDGKLIGPPMEKRAQAVLEKVGRIAGNRPSP